MFYKQMHVVRRYLHSFNKPFVINRYAGEYFGASRFNWPYQNFLPALWNPDKMHMSQTH